jgi:hypothetical protein
MTAPDVNTSPLEEYIHESVLSGLKRDPGMPLFHYTSQLGLLGILQSRSLWATNISYLNDAAENRHAISHVSSVLDEAESSSSTSDLLKQFCREIRSVVSKLPSVTRFVISFSEKGDLLSQWRAYCPDGTGFSVGFTLRQLAEKFHAFPGYLYKCEYDSNSQRAHIKSLFENTFLDFQRSGGKEKVPSVPKASKSVFAFMLNLGIIAPSFKDSAFSEEQEWRFVSTANVSNDQLRFRPGQSMVIPYCEVEIGSDAKELEIEQINVGPTPNMDLSVQSIEQLAVARQVKIIQGVMPSRIPYRKW